MHHTHTAQTLAVRFANELGQRHAGLVTAQAVQIDLALNGPVSLAQLAGDVGAHPRTSEAQGFIGVEQGADIKFVGQRITQGCSLVLLELPGHRLGGRAGQPALLSIGQRADGPHGARKQLLLGLPFFLLGLQGGLLGALALTLGQQGLTDLFQILQRWQLHPLPRLRIQSAVWKKLRPSRSRSTGSTPVSRRAWSMQASHWSRSSMPIENGMCRMRRRGWPKRVS